MAVNPVFLNELRQSVFRRKPVQGIALWAALTGFLMWVTQFLPRTNYPISSIPAFLLPVIVPAFAAGTFAKEYEQQTWQDLTLTRLTNAQVVLGKFGASLLMVWLIVLSFIPAMMLALIAEDRAWAYLPGWWTVVLAFKLLFSASLYVLIAMVCSRYSSTRRTAMVWSYIALFLYGIVGWTIWTLVGSEVEQVAREEYYMQHPGSYIQGSITERPSYQGNPVAPGFMEGTHLIFCMVAGGGALFLLWVSLSEQRGYRGGAGEESKRAWQPVGVRRSSSQS
jgi:hypothetical protein